MARKGRFEAADKGTIFLDEIGDLPLTDQTKLLRVLQEKTFERVGGNTTVKGDVRIIAATNKDLETLMREGKFREDLYYRLNVFPIVVPPLREHTTDIMLLANHFIEKYSREHDKKMVSISSTATNMLMGYNWPGNIRELENYIERAVILSNDGVIHGHHLPLNLQSGEARAATGSPARFKDLLADIEQKIIEDELKRSRGNMARAARNLRITERIMGLRIARYRIDPARFKDRSVSGNSSDEQE
jgi:Nif-specific regulatory protein